MVNYVNTVLRKVQSSVYCSGSSVKEVESGKDDKRSSESILNGLDGSGKEVAE